MGQKSDSGSIDQITTRFTASVLRLVRDHLLSQIGGLAPEPATERPRPAPRMRPLAEPAPTRPSRILAVAAKPVLLVHAADYVDRLVELVRQHPWPPKSRELQILLGVKKDPFLRIVDLALAAGRIRRTGVKSGVKYHPA